MAKQKSEENKEEENKEEVKEETSEENDQENTEKKSSFWTWIFILGIILVGIYIFRGGDLTGNAVSDNEIIKIGVMAPLSGDAAAFGLSIQNGIELARDQLGYDNVEIIYEDSECEGQGAATSLNKLISIDGVDAVIGEACSGATLAAAPIAEENGIPMVSPSSTSPEISNAGDYIFRTVPSDELQGKFASELIENDGHERLAILYGNEDYGLGLSEVLSNEFAGEIVAIEPFERGSTDLRTQITKIRNSNPDAIYIISNSPDSAVAALRQIDQLGLDAAIYGSEGLKSDSIIEAAGNAATGLIITSVSSGTPDFALAHKEKFNGMHPGPFSAQGYDAYKAIITAIQNGASTSEEIKDELYNVNFDGASGRIRFDSNGDIQGNYEVYEVRAGIFVPLFDFQPQTISTDPDSMEAMIDINESAL